MFGDTFDLKTAGAAELPLDALIPGMLLCLCWWGYHSRSLLHGTWHPLLYLVASEARLLSPGCSNADTVLYQFVHATQASVPCAMQCIIKGTFWLVAAVLYVPSAVILSTCRHERLCGAGHCLVMVWLQPTSCVFSTIHKFVLTLQCNTIMLGDLKTLVKLRGYSWL